MAEEERPSLHLVPGDGGGGHQLPPIEWQGPPWPHPEDVRLHVVVEAALEALKRGAVDPAGAILYAAVHGWFEGALDVTGG